MKVTPEKYEYAEGKIYIVYGGMRTALSDEQFRELKVGIPRTDSALEGLAHRLNSEKRKIDLSYVKSIKVRRGRKNKTFSDRKIQRARDKRRHRIMKIQLGGLEIDEGDRIAVIQRIKEMDEWKHADIKTVGKKDLTLSLKSLQYGKDEGKAAKMVQDLLDKIVDDGGRKLINLTEDFKIDFDK